MSLALSDRESGRESARIPTQVHVLLVRLNELYFRAAQTLGNVQESDFLVWLEVPGESGAQWALRYDALYWAGRIPRHLMFTHHERDELFALVAHLRATQGALFQRLRWRV